jgi:hypothetical protein
MKTGFSRQVGKGAENTKEKIQAVLYEHVKINNKVHQFESMVVGKKDTQWLNHSKNVSRCCWLVVLFSPQP